MNVWETRLGIDALQTIMSFCERVESKFISKQYTVTCKNIEVDVHTTIKAELEKGSEFVSCINTKDDYCVLIFKK